MTDLEVAFKISGRQMDYIAKLKLLVEQVLEIEISAEEILNCIIDSYINKQTYVSLFPLTKQLRITLEELEKATYFTDKEQRAMEYSKMIVVRNESFKALASLARRDLAEYGRLDLDFEGSNVIIDKMWNEAMTELNMRYKNVQFRGGIKVLIVKLTIVYAIFRDGFIAK